MKEPKRVLFVSQQIFPYLAEETPLRMLNRKLPQACQEAGIETRTFMPKFGEINERKNQLHEVIRLSGINIIIAESDHPLLLKVASIQSARIHVVAASIFDFTASPSPRLKGLRSTRPPVLFCIPCRSPDHVSRRKHIAFRTNGRSAFLHDLPP